MTGTGMVKSFHIQVDDAVLEDLRRRLDATRWPEEPADAGWRYGVNLDYLKDLVAYWKDGFDWRAVEARWNALPHYTAEASGSGGYPYQIHFIFEPGSGDSPLPLILTHGWPGSFVEYIDLIGPLAHPERFGGDVSDAFDVIVPSLPGYAFSSPPAAPINPPEIAHIWHDLMTRVLERPRFGAQGGDWGSVVSSWLGARYPEAVAGIHLNMLGLAAHRSGGGEPVNDEEQAWIKEARARLHRDGAYQAVQGTKPTSLNVGLTDSPAGLAAWIVEKFQAWSGTGADTPPPYDRDLLLANITLYWVTGSIGTANWLYTSIRQQGGIQLAAGEKVTVPTGFAFPAHDLAPQPPDTLIARAYNAVHRTDFPDGGHFLALDAPEALTTDIREFFRPLRQA